MLPVRRLPADVRRSGRRRLSAARRARRPALDGCFSLPMSVGDLEAAVLSVAGSAGPAPSRGDRRLGRPDGRSMPSISAARSAAALFTGEIGFAYAAAVDARRPARGHAACGSRCHCADTPELLERPVGVPLPPADVPGRASRTCRWSAMSRSARSSTRRVIDDAVRILGVIASPHDLAPLDVAAERRRRRAGRERDARRSGASSSTGWSRPRRARLRQALRDDTLSRHPLRRPQRLRDTRRRLGEGLLYLEDPDDGRAARLDFDDARQPAR